MTQSTQPGVAPAPQPGRMGTGQAGLLPAPGPAPPGPAAGARAPTPGRVWHFAL